MSFEERGKLSCISNDEIKVNCGVRLLFIVLRLKIMHTGKNRYVSIFLCKAIKSIERFDWHILNARGCFFASLESSKLTSDYSILKLYRMLKSLVVRE